MKYGGFVHLLCCNFNVATLPFFGAASWLHILHITAIENDDAESRNPDVTS